MNGAVPDLEGDGGVKQSRAPEYIAVVRRLRVPLLALLVAMPLFTLVFSALQANVYRSSSEVLLTHQNFATGLAGGGAVTTDVDPARIAATQARLARTPLVARETLREARATGLTPEEFLANSSVHAEPNADLLVFEVDETDADHAVTLATAYARAYTEVAGRLATAAIERAREGALRRINQLETAGDTRSRLYESLVTNEQQLRAMSALQTSNAAVVRPGDEAVRVQPRPLRNAILALALALVSAACLVALSQAFDTRVRDAEEAGELLRLPLLARLPMPSARALWRSRGLAMLDEPHGVAAQPFRMLKTTFEFAAFGADARTVMVTSGMRREGKSTTAANLALALARAGRRVILVDFDLREPTMHRALRLARSPGLTDIIAGRTTLDQALVPGSGAAVVGLDLYQPGEQPAPGSLEVLPAGRALAGPAAERAGLDVAEIAGSPVFDRLLAELRKRAEIVLFDTAPVLAASEVLTLTRKVDAVIVAASAEITRRRGLVEVRRVLDAAPTAALGYVFYARGVEAVYGYGYHLPDPRPRTSRQQAVR